MTVHEGEDIGHLYDKRIFFMTGRILGTVVIANCHDQLFREQPSPGELQTGLVVTDGKLGLFFRVIVGIAGIGNFPQNWIFSWERP